MNRGAGALATASMLSVAACATQPAPSPPGQAFSASVAAPPSARERKVIDLLSSGDVAPAKVEAAALVSEEPDNREAHLLQDEVNQDPHVLLGTLHFDLTVKAGDTFVELAERYLHDRALAYALARYNGYNPPNQPAAGQLIQIPGAPPNMHPAAASPRREEMEPRRTKAEAAKGAPAKTAPARPATAAEPKPTPSAPPPELKAPTPAPPVAAPPARDPAKAASLRGEALVAMNKGEIDHTVALLRDAAILDPDSAPIKADLERALRIQHGAHAPAGTP